MPSICRQPIFGALRDQASDVILTGIPEQRSTKTRNRRTSDQSESGKHDEVLQMFSLNVNLLTNLPMGPSYGKHGKLFAKHICETNALCNMFRTVKEWVIRR